MNIYKWRKPSKTLKVTIGIILVFMIFSRLTWLQIRVQKNIASPELATSVQDCNNQTDSSTSSTSWVSLETNLFQQPTLQIEPCTYRIGKLPELFHTNLFLTLITILLISLMVQMLTRSWLLTIACCAILLSRGAFLAKVTTPSLDPMITFLVTVWFMSCVHFFRTGSLASMVVGILTSLLGTLCHSSLSLLNLVVPAYVLRERWLYGQCTEEPLPRGRLLRSIGAPVHVWTGANKRWLQICLVWGFALIAADFFWPQLIKILPDDFHEVIRASRWVKNPQGFEQLEKLAPYFQLRRIDIHYFASFIFAAAYLWLRPKSRLQEGAKFLLFTLGGLIAFSLSVQGTYLLTTGSLKLGPAFALFDWFEPLILTFGLISLAELLIPGQGPALGHRLHPQMQDSKSIKPALPNAQG